jgi:putative glycosyl hydrolase-like family 15 (GHL15) protein
MLSLPRRSVARTLVAAFALTLLLFPVAGAQSAPAAETPSSLGIIRICTNCTSYGLNRAGSYRYILLHGWQSNLIPQLKAANPNLKILAYKNMAASYAYGCTDGVDNLYPAGVGYCDANAHHPEWFLADTTGARIEFCDYKGLWQMDVGNPEYQAAWEANVAADLRARGFDGVEVDDTNWNEQYHLCGRTIAKYPNNGDYGAATRSFLARVGPALKSKGFIVLPNIALPYSSSNYETWSDWISFTSGAIQEHFSKWGSGTTQQFGDADWKWRQGFLPLTQKAGKIFLGITYAPMSDVRSMVYARANFLLDWDGGPSAVLFEPSNPEQQDPYSVSWTQDIGTPLAPRSQVGVAWRRNYSAGTVVVNPSSTVTQDVGLGAPFIAADGSTVTSVSLAPMTAAVLRASSTVPALAPPAAPVAKTPPAISGMTKVGKTLAATTGTWSGSPTSFSYSWSSCDTRGANCTQVRGATVGTYLLTSSDGGRTVRVSVTARNARGSATATSAATAAVKGATRILAGDASASTKRIALRRAVRIRRARATIIAPEPFFSP